MVEALPGVPIFRYFGGHFCLKILHLYMVQSREYHAIIHFLTIKKAHICTCILFKSETLMRPFEIGNMDAECAICSEFDSGRVNNLF